MPVLKEQVGTNERVILGSIDLLRTQHIIREQDMARTSMVLINGAKYDLFNHTCGHVLGTRGSDFKVDLVQRPQILHLLDASI